MIKKLWNVLKSKINDIVNDNIIATVYSIEEIINTTKQANISKKTKWILYIAIAILILPFIIVIPVVVTLSVIFTTMIDIISFLVLIIPGYTLVTIEKLLMKGYIKK